MMMTRSSDLSRRRSGTLLSIPEESSGGRRPNRVDYKVDLGSGAAQSACPSPGPQPLKRPTSRRPATRRPQKAQKEPERDCGICFELAVAPVRTLCCAHLFCADHIMAWLHGPASDGLCPSCGAPDLDILPLGHPSLTHRIPPAPPSTPRSPSPDLSPTISAAPYASYPSTPAIVHQDPSSSSEEEEDSTDYSLPALVYARALQTRRHMPHPFSSVLGVRGALGRVGRIAVWLVLVAVLAGRGRWATDYPIAE
ncbi:hypothetical protein K438DRAFT_1038905 [Mycena galopus ATCC 62051]|nr:hypothetical protein K438DRAFT_1038905 [Mycena galopus ATCC 62051]